MKYERVRAAARYESTGPVRGTSECSYSSLLGLNLISSSIIGYYGIKIIAQ
jgi:hypothetical protein